MIKKARELLVRIEEAEAVKAKAELNIRAVKAELKHLLNEEGEQQGAELVFSDVSINAKKAPSMNLRKWIIDIVGDKELTTEQIVEKLYEQHGYTSKGIGNVLINMVRVAKNLERYQNPYVTRKSWIYKKR